MQVKGRCLVCDKNLREQEIPPESANMHQELAHIFFRYLCPNDLSAAKGNSSVDSYADVFPFCEECEQQVVTKLYQKHTQIQSGLIQIQQVMAITRSQRILCEIIEKRSLLSSLGISSDEETEEPYEQEPISFAASMSTSDTGDDCNSDVDQGFKVVKDGGKGADGIEVNADAGTSDSVTVVEETVDANSTEPDRSSMDSENYLEVLSDSDGSPANELDSDSSYTMGSESSDEDFTPAGPSIPKNRNASKQASGVESIEQLCPPSSSRKSEFEISDELYAIICRKQAHAPALIKHPLGQTGPKTYIYMEKYYIEMVEKGYKCCTCGYTQVKRADVMRHIRRTHNRTLHRNIRIVEKSPNKWYYAEFMSEKIGGKYSCGTCRYVTTYRKTMRDHLRYSHYVTAHPECGTALNLVCEVCGKVVPRMKMKQHLESHIDEPQFFCVDCGKKFVNQGKLSTHRRVHLGDQGKKIMCEHCGRKFYTELELKNHMFQHTGNREFVCKTCGNSYGSSGALAMHSNLHKGRRFDCDVCGAEFTQAYSLTRHKRSHHGIHAARAKGKPAEV